MVDGFDVETLAGRTAYGLKMETAATSMKSKYINHGRTPICTPAQHLKHLHFLQLFPSFNP